MFKQTATDLDTISTASFIEWINSFDTVLLDCDGKTFDFRKMILSDRYIFS